MSLNTLISISILPTEYLSPKPFENSNGKLVGLVVFPHGHDGCSLRAVCRIRRKATVLHDIVTFLTALPLAWMHASL